MIPGGGEHGAACAWSEAGHRGGDGFLTRTLRVLIVDRSPADAVRVADALSQAWTGLEACRVDGPEALRDALAERWDVVLVDEDVPGLELAEAIDAVRSSRPGVPCVALSALAGEDAAIAALKRGADDWVTKQDLHRLPAVIRREVDEAAVRRRAARAREALDLAEGRLEALAAGLQDRLFAFDEGGRITRVSGRPLPIEAITPVRPVGRELWVALGEPALEARLRPVLSGSPAAHAWSVGAPGEERWFQAHLTPVRVQEEVVGGIAVVRDVTELKALHAQVAMSDRMATIGSIAAGAAHDLCAPVAAALAALEEAARVAREHAALAAGGAPLLRALEDARAACEQIRHVARDVRTFSRADDRPPGEASADVTAVLDSAARMAAHELRGRATVVRDYGAVPAARASVPRLGQVFLNLIVNAAQAIEPGAPDRNVVRLHAGTAADGRVLVEIEDTGCGMAPEVLGRLFTPFFTTKPEGAGTGLGLTICHRIVQELGGEIGVTSEPGRGTRVRVLLPVAPPAPGAGASPVAGAERAGRPRVLVVDDEESVHRAMGRLLGKACDVACADAPAALARLEAGERFDLVLCDLSMPGISGLELRRRVEALDPEQALRVTFLTGGAFGAEAEECRATGGALVDKAARPDEIRASVEARLRALPPCS